MEGVEGALVSRPGRPGSVAGGRAERARDPQTSSYEGALIR